MFLVREAVLLARSSIEEEELDNVGEVTELMEFVRLEMLRLVGQLRSGVTAIEFDLLEVLRLVWLVRSGVMAMEFDLVELILPRPSLGG